MKRIIVLIICVLAIITCFIIYYNVPKNYEISYNLNDINIKESYNKDTNYLSLIINYKNVNYPLVINNNNYKSRKVITGIKSIESEKIICLNITIDDMIYPLCTKDNELIDYRLLPKEFLDNNNYQVENNPQLISDNNNIKLYNNQNQIIIWNYKGFYDIINNKQINIFDNEKYTNRQTYQVNNKLIIPDYDSNYFFKKIYIYDIETQKITNISFEEEISFDLYYLGMVQDNAYFIDEKNKVEYKVNLKKNILERISSDPDKAIYYDGTTFTEMTFNKLINSKITFINYSNFDYKIINDKLYLSLLGTDLKCSNKNITAIIKISNENVYYLVEDELYKYSIKDGEELLAKYSEWNFNYLNQIFIFD